AAAVEERDFEPYVRFEELGNLHQASAEPAARILRAVFWLVVVKIDFLELVDRFKHFLPHAVEWRIRGLCVHRLKTDFGRLPGSVHFELLQVRDRNSGDPALQGTRKIRAECDGAER